MNKKDKQMTWYDVTLYQFEKLQDLIKIENEEERMFAIAELLLGEEVTNLPISEFVSATKRLSFLSDEIETKTPPKNLELNGRKYTVDCLLGRISTAQYIDFQNHLKGNEDNEYAEGSEGEPNQSSEEFSGSDSNPFGIIPFVIVFCEVTNHNFEEAMNYDVSTLFYIVSYKVWMNKQQEKMIKQMQKRQK